MLAHVRAMVDATGLPVNADFGSGYADAPDAVADNVRRCVEIGVAGLSIEDATGDATRPLYDAELAAQRIRAARSAIDATDSAVVLTGRAEGFLVGSAISRRSSAACTHMPRRAPIACMRRGSRAGRTWRLWWPPSRRSRSTS